MPNSISADCNDLYKTIENIIIQMGAEGFYRLRKCDQPSGSELIAQIEAQPEYIHYCGHGGPDGSLQLLDEDGNPYSLKPEILAKYLNRHKKLQCLFLGSCNSDKLIELLRLYADYSIGFTKNPEPEFVNLFYQTFYGHLCRFGSPLDAFLKTQDQLIANRKKTAGAQVIFRSKKNYVMELIALQQQSLLEQLKISEVDSTIAEAKAKLATLEGEAYSLFENLLISHPFPEDVFWFYTSKSKLAYDIAKLILPNGAPEEVGFFRDRLFMTFEIIEKLLIAFEHRKMSKSIFKMVLKGQPKVHFINAIKMLGQNPEIPKRTEGFQLLFDDAIQYTLEVFDSIESRSDR